jgi:4-amino-4-deoxy-L-arabinose transferase-like glycosyltransferase
MDPEGHTGTAQAPPRARGRVRDRCFFVAAAAIVAVAAGLRFYRLGFQELWMDEGVSFGMATVEDFRAALRREYNPPIYYLLQRLWLLPFGESEAALRSLSAVFGTVFVAAIVWGGRVFLGPAVGLWSGALAAIAPLHIYYSQEARPYALLSLAIVLITITLWRAVQVGSWARWLAFSSCTLLALSTHYFAILVLAPAGLLVLLGPAALRGNRQWRRYAVASVLGLAPWLLWLAWSLLLNPHPRAGHDWIQRVWENLPPRLAIPKSMEVLILGSQVGFVPGFFKQFTNLEFPGWLRSSGLAVLALLWLWALLPWGESRMRIPECARRKAWLCGLVFLPLMTLWLASLWKPYYVVGRYDLVAFPAYLLILGFALAKLQSLARIGPALAGATALLLLAVLGAKLDLYYRAPSGPVAPSARTTARAIDAAVGPGDLIVLTPWRGISVNYYLRRLGYRRVHEACENPETGRAFLCAIVPSSDASMVLDFDHMDRVAFSLEVARADLRTLLARIDPARHSVWVERRSGPGHWLVVSRMISEELARAGFRRSPHPGVPAGLRFWRFEGSGPGLGTALPRRSAPVGRLHRYDTQTGSRSVDRSASARLSCVKGFCRNPPIGASNREVASSSL